MLTNQIVQDRAMELEMAEYDGLLHFRSKRNLKDSSYYRNKDIDTEKFNFFKKGFINASVASMEAEHRTWKEWEAYKNFGNMGKGV